MTVSDPASSEECMELIRTMGSVHKALSARLSPILMEQYGIDLRLFILLRQIHAGVAHPGELARGSMETPSQITRRLDKLEALDLIRRSLDRTDSRRVRLELTERGLGLLDTMDASAAGVLGPALAALDADRRRVLVGALKDLAANLQAPPAE